MAGGANVWSRGDVPACIRRDRRDHWWPGRAFRHRLRDGRRGDRCLLWLSNELERRPAGAKSVKQTNFHIAGRYSSHRGALRLRLVGLSVGQRASRDRG